MSDGRNEGFDHEPVMVEEITEILGASPPGTIVDATLGGGGHSAALLGAQPHLSVLGIDRDQQAIDAAGARLAEFGERFHAAKCRYDELPAALDAQGLTEISGALFDLGVSSPQLDHAGRGFSYRHDGPLDMRMDDQQRWSAADIVNGYERNELARVIRRYGDERFASRIASAICAARPVQSTTELAAIVTAAIPAAARRTGGHPAKRTFQAIRIEVNQELEALPIALDEAVDATVPGGRIAVLSYHSGEDRIAKERIRAAETGGCECPPELPCVCGAVQTVRVVRAPKRPSGPEAERNRRAASARFRVAEKTEPTPRGATR